MCVRGVLLASVLSIYLTVCDCGEENKAKSSSTGLNVGGTKDSPDISLSLGQNEREGVSALETRGGERVI